MYDDIIFRALTGRAPTQSERLASLNERREGPGRWVAAGGPDHKAAEAEARRRADLIRQDDAAFAARVAHLDNWHSVAAAARIHSDLPHRWLGAIRVDRDADHLRFVSWLCKAASVRGKDAAWVQDTADYSQAWKDKYHAAARRAGDKKRPFDLAPGLAWRHNK